MKILIVSGFLGAGKTTFIKALAKNTGREFAILENEYGAEGIDGERLSGFSNDDINIWEMTEGCICCSAKGDFAASVLTVANTVDPEYLVVEPTGVGMLGQIIENLQKIEYEHISLLSPVTVVDCFSLERYLKEYPVLYSNQIKEAGTVIVSKTENASLEEKSNIRQELQKLNPSGKIVTDHYSGMEEDVWRSLLETKLDGSRIKENIRKQETLPDTFSMTKVYMHSPEQFICFLEALIRGRFGNVLRAKGHFLAGNQALSFDVADGRYSITGADGIKDGKVVFIGTEIHRQEIRRYFLRKIMRSSGKENVSPQPGSAMVRPRNTKSGTHWA